MAYILRGAALVLLYGALLVAPKTLHHTKKAKAKDGSELAVPLPAIILLSVLGFCLILFAVLYKFLRFDICCRGDSKEEKKADKTDRGVYAELGQTSEAEEDEEDHSGFESLTVSNPAHTMDSYPYPGGRKISKARSASMVPSMSRQIDSRYFLAVHDRNKLSKDPNGRVRSESDLSVGATAADYNARYGSWTHGLQAPVSGSARAMSAYGDLTSMRSPEDRRSRFAKLQVSLSYAPTAQRLEIEVMRVEEIHDKLIQSGIAAEVVVHVCILPSKRSRFKTKAKSIHNPSFHERWVVRNVSKKELRIQQLRCRLYSHEFLGTGRVLGETIVDVMSFDLEEIGDTKWLTFSPTAEIKNLLRL